ncbi:hypothetical protein [Nocardia sp. NBC_01329]|uniref:hypothetical protein n=1 Tax=Nocardia sp. NBC_01329 TaxID=2903594 RepID=UPI002E0E3A56|nr:hypothetical protein OG405_22665 [Nocardia sp. NBC_01329]
MTLLEIRRKWHRPLMVSSAVLAGLVLVSGLGLLVDDRELLGESIWLKPLKFSFAFGIYAATLAWLLAKLDRGRRVGWWMGVVFAVFAVIEVGLITIIAARGSFSHFNVGDADPVNRVLVAIFQNGVPAIFFSNLAIAVVVLIQRTCDQALSRAMRAGIVLSTIGTTVPLWLGVGVNARERTVADADGATVTLFGAHGIGDPDGAGMPITNWSTTGGDMRVPHFIGMHGIHIMLLTAALLVVLATRYPWLRDERVRAHLIGIVALGYIGLLAGVAWQARRGQSLIHPDRPTLVLFAGLALATTAAIASSIIAAERRPASPGATE